MRPFHRIVEDALRSRGLTPPLHITGHFVDLMSWEEGEKAAPWLELIDRGPAFALGDYDLAGRYIALWRVGPGDIRYLRQDGAGHSEMASLADEAGAIELAAAWLGGAGAAKPA